ncbi:ABC transporter permease [Neomegalonema perideroedes]|uniref:ABC transporter permease n=1 Tax=Neomegalonema perideroedes TaxID=217219 RepID=UPI00035D7CBF|nr:ABC transporter permease [Neomegalonema perideroedes]
MTRRLLERLGQALLVLWAAFTIAFVLLQLMPGDAVLIKFVGGDLGLSPEAVAEIRAFYGADAPAWRRYLDALAGVVTGDFGYSIASGVPVAEEIRTNLPATLWLAGLAFALAVGLALLVAFLATLGPFAWLRGAFQALPGLMVSIPVFWLGVLLIQIFSFKLGWVSVIAPGPWERLVLPVIAISIPIAAPLAQILIRNLDAVSTAPFVHVARAKGASRRWVMLRHVLRNALLPALTIAGVLFGELLAGAVVTETVFGLNGIGRLAEQAVRAQDAAVLQAVVLIAAFGFVAINLIVDLLYPLFDPRLRRGGRAPA